MYKIEYLPLALQDMEDIARYIAKNLNNIDAAEKLSSYLIKSINKIVDFPYSNPIYIPIRTLEKEYRKKVMRNYTVFYWINEIERIVTISRVIYSKRNINNLL